MQLLLGYFGDVSLAFSIVDADGQFKSDPVLNYSDAELGGHLDHVHISYGRVASPPPDYKDWSQGDSNERKYVEH